MRVLHASSELFPLLKTGGLADVLGALPQAQIAAGADARLVMPAFPDLLNSIENNIIINSVETFAGQVALRFGVYDGIGIYLIDAPYLYQREGSPYHDDALHAYADNYKRFALLGWMACELACGLDPQWCPEIVHAHDWHAGLSAAYLAAKGYPARAVLTVHNLAYQGLFSAKHFDELQLPKHFFTPEGLEFYGQISYLKAGIVYANKVIFVSPTYAKEVVTAEYGCGLENLLKQCQSQDKLVGILNGVDYQIWDPKIDTLIPSNYALRDMQGKLKCKIAHQTENGLTVTDKVPLFGIVSRLTSQKGLDLLLAAIPNLLNLGGQITLLGCGDPNLQEAYQSLAQKYPKQIAVRIGYDEAYAHQLIAAADVILVPSRYEPCGLTQLYGLKYGAIPLVKHTGGLADTVRDCSLENLADKSATGFVFYDNHDVPCQHNNVPQYNQITELNRAIRRAFALWADQAKWRRVRRQGMSINFSWQLSAEKYLALYQSIT